MITVRCAQRGCVFQAEEMPAHCPVCGNPIVPELAGQSAADVAPAELTLEQRLEAQGARIGELELELNVLREREARHAADFEQWSGAIHEAVRALEARASSGNTASSEPAAPGI